MPIKIKNENIDKEHVYGISEVRIYDIQNDPRANMSVLVKSAKDGKVLDKKIFKFFGEDFNYFWENFNSGKFLYEVMAKQSGLVIVPDESLEDEFKSQSRSKNLENIKKSSKRYVKLVNSVIMCILSASISAVVTFLVLKYMGDK